MMAPGYGACIISDTVTVGGLPIRYMYRVMPERRQDSGWRFFSGLESVEYLSGTDFMGVYDVNIAANYTPDIIDLLNSPPYSAYEKSPDNQWIDVSLHTDWQSLS